MKKIVLFFAFCYANLCPIMSQSALDKLSTCLPCHSPKGIGITTQIPTLAAQHKSYLIKQLQDFKTGRYKSTIMNAIAETLTEEEIETLASYYAKQEAVAGLTPLKYLQRGEQLYRGGDFSLHISACIACHGPKGRGNGPAGFPLLSGQKAAYLIQQLQAFKENKRANDLNHIMQDISARMRLEDMEAVAYYIQGLH